MQQADARCIRRESAQISAGDSADHRARGGEQLTCPSCHCAQAAQPEGQPGAQNSEQPQPSSSGPPSQQPQPPKAPANAQPIPPLPGDMPNGPWDADTQKAFSRLAARRERPTGPARPVDGFHCIDCKQVRRVLLTECRCLPAAVCNLMAAGQAQTA